MEVEFQLLDTGNESSFQLSDTGMEVKYCYLIQVIDLVNQLVNTGN